MCSTPLEPNTGRRESIASSRPVGSTQKGHGRIPDEDTLEYQQADPAGTIEISTTKPTTTRRDPSLADAEVTAIVTLATVATVDAEDGDP